MRRMGMRSLRAFGRDCGLALTDGVVTCEISVPSITRP